LLLFQEQRVDVAVLEVGLGGRLDAVNIIDADCSIITSIDIDHAEYLGNTREQVAWEKAHIFRADRPAICADPVPPQTMLDYAQEIGAQLWLFGKDFNYSGDRQQWAYGGRNQRRAALAYPALRGANQLLNASAALAALESLHPRLAVPAQAVRAGLLRAHMPGRFQIQPGQPCVIFDVAHNPHAAAALAQNLDNMPPNPKTIAVVGMYKDKDVDGVIARMATRIDHWMCASLEGPRSMSGEELANHVRTVLASGQTPDDVLAPEAESGSHRPGVRPVARASVSKASAVVSSYNSPQLAYEAALKEASDNDRIVVFGSFATVGPILEAANDRSSS